MHVRCCNPWLILLAVLAGPCCTSSDQVAQPQESVATAPDLRLVGTYVHHDGYGPDTKGLGPWGLGLNPIVATETVELRRDHTFRWTRRDEGELSQDTVGRWRLDGSSVVLMITQSDSKSYKPPISIPAPVEGDTLWLSGPCRGGAFVRQHPRHKR